MEQNESHLHLHHLHCTCYKTATLPDKNRETGIKEHNTAVTRGHFLAWSTDQEFRYLSFDLANSFYENCCISKTIRARRSVEASKSSQRNQGKKII